MGNNKSCYTNTKFINLWIVLSFLLLSIFSSIILVKTRSLFSGTDMMFHLKRIIEMRESIAHGVFPQYSFNQFHGSAVMILYPYMNFIPLIVLSFFVKSNIFLIYFWLDFNVFIALLISFFSSRYFSKSNLTSYMFSITYSLSNVFMSYIFYDSDYGVATVIAVLPLIVFGFLRVLICKSSNEFIIGMAVVICSHVLSIFIIIGFLILWIIINYKLITVTIIKNIIKSSMIILLLTSIIWIPAIYFGLINARSIDSVGFSVLHGTKINLLMQGLAPTNITYALSLCAFLGIFLSIIFYKHFKTYEKQMFWISIIFIFICSTLFPWNLLHFNIFKFLKVFQFSWRFYIIPQVLLCYIFSKCITKYLPLKKFIKGLSVFVLFMLLFFQICYQYKIISISYKNPSITSSYINYNNDKLSIFHMQYIDSLPKSKYKFTNTTQFADLYNIDGNGFLYFGDYYPKENNKRKKLINTNKIVSPNHTIYFKHIGYNKFYFNNKHDMSHVELPIFKYKSENLKIYLDNKRINYGAKNNLIFLNRNIHNGQHIIYIKYIPNQFIKYLSIIIMLFGISFMVYQFKIYKWVKFYFLKFLYW